MPFIVPKLLNIAVHWSGFLVLMHSPVGHAQPFEKTCKLALIDKITASDIAPSFTHNGQTQHIKKIESLEDKQSIKNAYVEKFITHWRSVIYADFNLINDASSQSPNEPDFVDHRHDQSIFSILSTLEGITDTVSAYEYFYPKNYRSDKTTYLGDWDSLKKFPIHVRRDLN